MILRGEELEVGLARRAHRKREGQGLIGCVRPDFRKQMASASGDGPKTEVDLHTPRDLGLGGGSGGSDRDGFLGCVGKGDEVGEVGC
jgi:hypothetical protein